MQLGSGLEWVLEAERSMSEDGSVLSTLSTLMSVVDMAIHEARPLLQRYSVHPAYLIERLQAADASCKRQDALLPTDDSRHSSLATCDGPTQWDRLDA